MLSIPYTRHAFGPSDAFPSGDEIPRALCFVGIRSGEKGSKIIQAMIDTGSDFCIFPADVLDDIGIGENTLKVGPVKGLGEGQKTYFATVTLWVENLGEWEVYAGFSEYLRGTGSGLLGFRGFMERFKIEFDPKLNAALITPV
jgi:hypothetical protein